MTRLPAVSERDAGLSARVAFYFMRRHFARLTGRQNETMLEPVRIMAHIPKLLSGYGKLEQAVAKVHLLEPRHRALAELKAATTVRCEYCIDLGSRISRDWGLSEEELLALPNYRSAACFSDVDKLVLDYAAAMSRTRVEVSDELFDRLRGRFSTPQLVELTFIVALENLRGRFNLSAGVGAAGFSEGMVCALPDEGRG
jgi:alkylhydroperoxidase family enzyme